jgi:uncharacterized membrane protein YfcA
LTAVFIGVSKAGFGGGTGILISPFLTWYYQDARLAVGIQLPLLFACDIVTVVLYWRQWDGGTVLTLATGAGVGIVLGAMALGQVSNEILVRSIGAIAVFFSLAQIAAGRYLRRESSFRPGSGVGFLVGIGTGFVSTLSHIGGILTTMFLLGRRLDNRGFVATASAVYFLINLGKLPVYAYLGMLDQDLLVQGMPYYVFLVFGAILGIYLNRRISSLWFFRVVLGLVLLTGSWLLLMP